VEVALDDLVLRPVNEGGRRIGTVEDVVLNCTLGRVLGVDVVCDGRRRFVPWVTLSVRDEELALTVPLDRVPRGLSLLLAHGTRLSETRHGPGVVVDRLGELRPSWQALASTASGAA
jgi:sporulation protein YlmC with PRC-barrel domain